jgi:hypothetical protein
MLLALALAVLGAGIGLACGGGSPTDVVPAVNVNATLVPTQAPGPRSVDLQLASQSGRDVSIRVVGTGFQDVTAVAFELAYDADFVDFAGAGGGTFFGQDAVIGANPVQAAPGRLVGVAAAASQSEGRSGDGTLLTLQFRIKALRDGEMPLIFGGSESLVYGPAGVVANHGFHDARLVTRILTGTGP